MAGKRIHVVMSDELVERIDAALGVGQSRGDWLRRAVEQALDEEHHDQRHRDQYGARERFRQASSSQAKRGVEPRPKGKR